VDPGLGYIVPGQDGGSGLRTVLRFVEKPPAAAVRGLIAEGALWNAFIVAARARALLELFERRYPGVVAKMQAAVARDAGRPAEPRAVSQLYESLPEIDFSRHIAEVSESALRVLTVPACGWSDLGTPARVARTLEKLPARLAPPADASFLPGCGQLSLATQYAQSTPA
jgi:mannose-1-phosphate guanylyltransferase